MLYSKKQTSKPVKQIKEENAASHFLRYFDICYLISDKYEKSMLTTHLHRVFFSVGAFPPLKPRDSLPIRCRLYLFIG